VAEVSVEVVTTAALAPEIERDIRALLDAAFAGEFTPEDWAHALGGWHALVRDGDTVVAHAAVVPRALEVSGAPFAAGYVEGVATAPHRQDEGFGSRAMRALEPVLRREFAFGALSTGEHGFYERLGWERWRGPTFVRQPTGDVVRTEDEDDGIMVLRYGPSAEVDLEASLTCPARDGDDW
jgi:aminoglycoside 2'-N-acetyltransferase I